MPLIKDNSLVQDSWVVLEDNMAIVSGQDTIVSLNRWLAEKENLQSHDARIGIRLESDQSPSLIASDLDGLDLVALDFPAFKDGRAYSYAHLLRERYGYEGEVRAIGDVHRDQYFYMLRCGFDAFEVASEEKVPGFLEAANEFSTVYQPSSDRRNFVIAQRHRVLQAAE